MSSASTALICLEQELQSGCRAALKSGTEFVPQFRPRLIGNVVGIKSRQIPKNKKRPFAIWVQRDTRPTVTIRRIHRLALTRLM